MLAFMQLFQFHIIHFWVIDYACRPGSVVGVATAYGLDGPGIKFLVGKISQESFHWKPS